MNKCVYPFIFASQSICLMYLYNSCMCVKTKWHIQYIHYSCACSCISLVDCSLDKCIQSSVCVWDKMTPLTAFFTFSPCLVTLIVPSSRKAQ